MHQCQKLVRKELATTKVLNFILNTDNNIYQNLQHPEPVSNLLWRSGTAAPVPTSHLVDTGLWHGSSNSSCSQSLLESLLKARPDGAQPKCDCCQPAPWTSVDIRLGPLGMAGNGGTRPADPKFPSPWADGSCAIFYLDFPGGSAVGSLGSQRTGHERHTAKNRNQQNAIMRKTTRSIEVFKHIYINHLS